MTETAWILLGDVIDSREIADRDAFETRLTGTLRRVADEYEEDVIEAPRRIKGIDEIAGVLGSVENVVGVQRQISLGVHPERIRLVVVRGDVERVGAGDVTEMRGAGFADAADELDRVEAAGETFSLVGLPRRAASLSATVNLLDYVRSTWTERRVEVLRAVETHGSQAAAASELGVSRQAINGHLTDESVKTVDAVERTLSEELSSLAATSSTEI
ncbi:SatD family protein [Halobaculum sp. MBLA0147]|uniref:SatD family protein n=1 Tax=Halobaculum sp. MBLA0147 TaxID=3079934 RepID=UPI003523323C